MKDPIVEEVRRIRDAHAAQFNYDLDAIFRDIKEQEKKSGFKFVAGVARQIAPSGAQQPAGTAMPIPENSKVPQATPAAEL